MKNIVQVMRRKHRSAPAEPKQLRQSSSTTTKRERRIRDALELFLILQLHGGGWQLIGIDGSLFMARLAGACTSCKRSGASVGRTQVARG